ncbi:MAG: hypothetical protein QNJ51_00865 [Calothrix sp. MO_167.B12]|nr:hypothetical protein [Calothrix sp. MO_167.B12]
MDIESLQATPAEIAQFRTHLADYPEAIAALDKIEQCGGYLQDAVELLLIQETGQVLELDIRDADGDSKIDKLLKQCRQFICQEEVRDALESGVLAPAIEPIAIGAGIPPGTATALGICVFKLGIKKFCGKPNSQPENNS